MRLKSFNLSLGSQIFKACSDESRLRILHLIFENDEMCISDLEKILEFTQTKTSRHLTYLKNSGILTFRRHNHWVFYAIKDEVYEILKQIFSVFKKRSATPKGPAIISDIVFKPRAGSKQAADGSMAQTRSNDLIS